MSQPKIFFLGTGKMATALVSGMLQNGEYTTAHITAYDKNPSQSSSFAKQTNVRITLSAEEGIRDADMIVFSIKPQNFAKAAEDYQSILKDKLIISIMAGISLEKLIEKTSSNRIVRIMPNITATIGAGVSVYIRSRTTTDAENTVIQKMLGSVGIFEYFGDEQVFNPATALSGSGPAFVCEFIKALTDGAVICGMPLATAKHFAAATVAGTAQMVLMNNMDAVKIRDDVMSPGGTTAQGIRALDKNGFRSAVIEAIIAANEKSAELGK
jgi:pyrroline-5-carboxylate reductase